MLENKEHEELKFITWLKENGYVHYDLKKTDIFCGDESVDVDFIIKFKDILSEIQFNKDEIKYLLNKKLPSNIYFRGNSSVYAEEDIPVKFYIFYRYPSFKILHEKIFKEIGFTFEELLDFYRDSIYSLKDQRFLNFSEWILKDIFELKIDFQTRTQKRETLNKSIDEFISYDNLKSGDFENLSFEDSSDRIFVELKNDSPFFVTNYVNYFIKMMSERAYYIDEYVKKILNVYEINPNLIFDKNILIEKVRKLILNNPASFNRFIEREDYNNINDGDYILLLLNRLEKLIGVNNISKFLDTSSKENALKNKNIEDTDKFYKKDYQNQIMLFVLRKKIYKVAAYYLEKGYKLNVFEEKIIRSNKKALSFLNKYLTELSDDDDNFLSLLMQSNTKKNNDILIKYKLSENDYIKIEESRQNNKKIPYNIKGKEDELLYYSPIIQTIIKSPEKTCILLDKIELDEKEKFLLWNALFNEIDKDNESYRDKLIDYIHKYPFEIKKELAKNMCIYLEDFLWSPNKKKIFNFIGYKIIDFCYELLVVDDRSTDFDKNLFVRMMTLRNVTNAKYLMYNIYPLAKYLSSEQISFIFDNSLVDVFKVYEEGLKSLHSYREADLEMMNDFKTNFTFKALDYLVEKGEEKELYEKMDNFYGEGTNFNYNNDKIKEFMVFFKNTMLSYQMKKNIKENDDKDSSGSGRKRRL